MTDKKIFSVTLKDLRKRKGLTQQEVATKLGLSRSIVSFLENGQQQPQLHHLSLLKEKFGWDLFDTVHNVSDMERAYYGQPREAEPTASALAEMYNSQREVKRDLLQASDLFKEMEIRFNELPQEITKGLKVIQSLINQAYRKI